MFYTSLFFIMLSVLFRNKNARNEMCIRDRDKAGLSLEQAEIAEELKGFEENQYPWEEFNNDLE